MNCRTLFIVLITCFSITTQAQDPVFTQYFIIPETLNPGYTGFLETTYAGVIHRSQWPDLNLKVDTDYAFVNTWSEKMNSGLGASVLSHRENNTNYSLTQFNVNYSYKVALNDNWYFRPGIELGFGTKSFGFQGLVLGDQINIGAGTINGSSADPAVLNNKFTFFDFSAGMLVNNHEAWFGLSLKHLNKPNISFVKEGNVPLDMFFSASMGYEFLLSDYVDILSLPYDTKFLISANYMNQGSYNRLDFGSSLLFKTVYFGVSTATNPWRQSSDSHFITSVNAFGGLQYEHFKFGLSHDFSTSKIGKSGGIYELSLTYQFDLNVKCFGCPNYENRN